MNKHLLILLFLSVFSTFMSSQNIANVSGTSVTVNTGAIECTISGGRMESLNIIDGENLLANGGYGYFSYNDQGGFYSPSFLEAEVAVNNSEIADIYFTHSNSFVVEMHYVFRKGESGFYTYFVTSDNGQPYKVLSELRWAVRVDKDIFDYAWTVEREGPMIHPNTLSNVVSEIQDATYELQDGSIYTKYDWAVDSAVDSLHGLLGNGMGIWHIEGSNEYINGGPTMQELTVHGTTTTPILLSSLLTSHYGNIDVALKDEYSEWSKIWGPAYTYINVGTKESVIEDAKIEASEKKSEWPYEWMNHELYVKDRGTVTGSLNMLGHGEVDSAVIVLCKPPASWHPETRDFQMQPYDYTFYSEVNNQGEFQIEKVRPGVYNLYAYTQKGKLIDDLKVVNVEISVGQNELGTIDWNANDKDFSLFQIGVADHKSKEFALADLPRLYGRWKDTPDNLEYQINSSNDREDWYYCQRENTAWDIIFEVDNLDSLSNPVLKVAFAGADAGPHLDAILNDQEIGYIRAGSDSAIRRSSLSGGKYSLVSFPFDKEVLVEGENKLTLSCFGSEAEYKGLMYDAILLEADISAPVSTSDEKIFDDSYYAYTNQQDIIVRSRNAEDAAVDIYLIGTGQLLYTGKIQTGKNHINLDRSGQVVVVVSDRDHVYRKKIILF